MWHGYIGFEFLNVTDAQKQAIANALHALGPQHDIPCHLNHFVWDESGTRVIFEALFDEDTITLTKVKHYLANAVGINPDIVSDNVTSTAFGLLVTLVVGGINRLRFCVFGGINSDYTTSHSSAIVYEELNPFGGSIE
jgi:hypothetical protein